MNAMPIKQQFFESGSWNYLALPAGVRVSLMTLKIQYSKRYQTLMVDECGKKSKHFNSFLSHLGSKIGAVILDAVYVESAERIYLLDLIYWNQWFTDYPFEVRQFFLKTKINDVSQMLQDNQSLGISIIPELNQVSIRQLYYQMVDSDFKAKIQNSKTNLPKKEQMEYRIKKLMRQLTPASLEEQFLEDNYQNLKAIIKMDQFSSLYLARGYIFMHSDSIYVSKIQNQFALLLPSLEYIHFQNYFHQQAESSMKNQWRKQLTFFIDPELNFKTIEGVTVYKMTDDQKLDKRMGLFRVKFNSIKLIDQNIELSGIKQIKRDRKSKVASISEVIYLMKLLSNDSDDVLTLNKLIHFSDKN